MAWNERGMASVWQDAARQTHGDPFPKDDQYDVVVIGGGLTGLRTADRLLEQGRSVMVVERLHVGAGCTGQSTGHLSWLFDVGLPQLRAQHGDDVAGRVVRAMRSAIQTLGQRLQALQQDESLVTTDLTAWTVATTPQQLKALRQSWQTILALGMPVAWSDAPPMPFANYGGYRCPDQARMQPAAACRALAQDLRARGCRIVENEEYHSYRLDGKTLHLTCRSGEVRARHLVLATHTPTGMHSVQTAIKPTLSYALAVRIEEHVDDALYYDMNEPYHYLRLMDLPDGGTCLVIGGADRAVGSEQEEAAFAELRKFTRRYFTVREEIGHWTGMYFEPSDCLPFIGNFLGQERVWYATGFSGDGLTWAEIAADIITSGIADTEHPLASVVKPQRIKAATTGKFMKQNMHAGKHFILDRLPIFQHPTVESLAPGSGMVIGQGLRHVAVARLEDGSLHACSATCPHMGCRVHYNQSDRSFDCPCHGSRFALDGKVIEGPASEHLEAVDAPKSDKAIH